MKKIEVLYSEVCNFFGDMYNINYLSKCIKDVEVIYTKLNDVPYFVNNKVDMIYMAPMTESTQELVIEKLKPYVNKINKLIENNVIFLLTGNAIEVFGKYIENEDESKIEGLGITNLYSKRDMMNRYNSPFLGQFDDIKIVGFKSQFSMSYGDNNNTYLFEALRGDGINKQTKFEGIRINNFFATYILGPILILNPLFTKYILNLMDVDCNNLPFEDEITKCYTDRLSEFEGNRGLK